MDKLIGALVSYRVIILFIFPLIIMASYNYVGPNLSSLFTGKTLTESKDTFTDLGYWEAFVLYILASILFKGMF